MAGLNEFITGMMQSVVEGPRQHQNGEYKELFKDSQDGDDNYHFYHIEFEQIPNGNYKLMATWGRFTYHAYGWCNEKFYPTYEQVKKEFDKRVAKQITKGYSEKLPKIEKEIRESNRKVAKEWLAKDKWR